MQRQQGQLPLLVQLRDDATLENFLPTAETEALIGVLESQCAEQGEAVVYLHGAAGSGKSHLLQACCHLTGESALYLPLAELYAYPPEEVLAGVETLTLVALDDLDAVIGEEAWELALFDLYNRAREWGCRLLIAASGASWGVVYHLPAGTDEVKRAILRFRAQRRGLQMSEEVVAYIFARARRDLAQLLEVLDRLDRASLAEQRALSIPFIKQTLDW
ncbi:DnaA regulatory inactivator Hda [Pseudohalioglobus lutimaris]|uniref:DnaA regulatory inactivator Hda n=1 Tax=Pseudohalioglobus lutimaris TaxID=1737061 RepID=A0A2N5WWW5_9GAMM|nr:DnaA regulatory inactivator Hda [Pseudohalioglobus lutimaris]PLW66728.1 DnaA regulatory inactivator Hda [Pseudohalioglobus lutimaris]